MLQLLYADEPSSWLARGNQGRHWPVERFPSADGPTVVERTTDVSLRENHG